MLVLELVRGGELFERILDDGAFLERPAQSVIATTAEALAHLHALGITHGDIKPENILLSTTSDEGQGAGNGAETVVKLADFGHAYVSSYRGEGVSASAGAGAGGGDGGGAADKGKGDAADEGEGEGEGERGGEGDVKEDRSDQDEADDAVAGSVVASGAAEDVDRVAGVVGSVAGVGDGPSWEAAHDEDDVSPCAEESTPTGASKEQATLSVEPTRRSSSEAAVAATVDTVVENNPTGEGARQDDQANEQCSGERAVGDDTRQGGGTDWHVEARNQAMKAAEQASKKAARRRAREGSGGAGGAGGTGGEYGRGVAERERSG